VELICYSRCTQPGDERFETGIATKIFEIVVRRHAVGVVISALDGFPQILDRFVGSIRGRCYAGEAIPHAKVVSSRSRVVVPCRLHLETV
jgi:hypothetical protein